MSDSLLLGEGCKITVLSLYLSGYLKHTDEGLRKVVKSAALYLSVGEVEFPAKDLHAEEGEDDNEEEEEQEEGGDGFD